MRVASKQFRKAVTLNPDDPESQYDLGRELKADGNNCGARLPHTGALSN